MDTNIRRVHARLFSGAALPSQALTAAEMRLAAQSLPDDVGASVRWNASVMELGALVCTARSPKCGECPVSGSCAWLAAGEPPPTYTPKGQSWHGTDRQVRGAVMAVLRVAESPVAPELFQRAPADLGFEPDGIGVPLAALHRLNSRSGAAGTRPGRAAERRAGRAAARRLPASRLIRPQDPGP